MKRKYKFFILAWVIFSWLALIAITIKPTGTLNTLKRAWIAVRDRFYTPSRYVLADFELARDLREWKTGGLFAQISCDRALAGQCAVKLVFVGHQRTARYFSLEDYILGPHGKRDWRSFHRLTYGMINPYDTAMDYHIKIKDSTGKAFDVKRQAVPGITEVALDLAHVGQFVDLSDIVQCNFYFVDAVPKAELYIDSLLLMKEEGVPAVLSQPILTLKGTEIPATVKRGVPFVLTATVSLTKTVDIKYKFFIHISHQSELDRRPSDRMWILNADQNPWVPTSQWKAGVPYAVGPIELYIPDTFPSGEYVVQMGLFNPASHGAYSSRAPKEGTIDFRSSYPRLRYAAASRDNYVVARVFLEE